MSFSTSFRFLASAIVIGWIAAASAPLGGDPLGKPPGKPSPELPPQVSPSVARIEPGVYYIAARQMAYGRLEVPSSPIGEGAGEIACTTPDNSPQQRWYIAPDVERPGRYTITCNAGRNAYLQPKSDVGPLPLQSGSGINEAGRSIWYYPRWDTSYQSWIFSRTPGNADTYTITNDGSGLTMGLKATDRRRVEQSRPSGSIGQHWVLLRVE